MKIPRVLLENPPREMKIPSWNLFSFDNTDSRVLPVFNVPEVVEECIRISKQKLCTVAYDFKNSANQCKLNENRYVTCILVSRTNMRSEKIIFKRDKGFFLCNYFKITFSVHTAFPVVTLSS